MSTQVISKQVLVECNEPFYYVLADVHAGLDSGFYVKVESSENKTFKSGIPIEKLPKLKI